MGVRFTLWAVDAPRFLSALTHEEISKGRENSLHLAEAFWRVSTTRVASESVQRILDGHYRWWIGSFVESLRLSPWTLNKEDIEQAESALSTLLKGLDCGTSMRTVALSESSSSFPIFPRCDVDLRFAVLPWSDFELLRLLFDDILREQGRRFKKPSGNVGLAPKTEADWDAWVRQVLQTISQTPLVVRSPFLVSFLG